MAAYADISNYGAVDTTSSTPTTTELNANRDALQAAITFVINNGGGTVNLPHGGQFPMSKNSGSGATSLYSAVIDGKGEGVPLTILGNGATLRQSGPGAGTNGDWYGIKIQNSANVTFDNGCSSQRDVSSSGEQTHMFQVGDGTTDASRVTWNKWKFTEGYNGDGVRLIGGTTGEAKEIDFDSCLFDGCDRSGIVVQRGVRRVRVTNCTFKNTDDQDIDFEPSSDGFVGEVNLIGNDFHRHSTATPTAITLSGYGGTYASRNNVVAFNRIFGGCLSAGNCHDTQIFGNWIEFDRSASTESLLYFFRRGDNLKIFNNTFTRGANCGANPVIYIAQNNSYAPEDIWISGNKIVQNVNANAIELEGVRRWVVNNNRIDLNFSTANTFYGVKSRALFQSISGVFSNNVIKATNAKSKAAVWFAPYSDTNIVDYAECTNNTVINSQYEADYGTSGITRYGTLPLHCNNTADSTVARFTGISAVRTGAASFLSSASPNGVITGRRGDICQRTDTAGMWYCSADGTTWGQWH